MLSVTARGMLSVTARDLRTSDELIRDGRFVAIPSSEVADDQVCVALGTEEQVTLLLDEEVRTHRTPTSHTDE